MSYKVRQAERQAIRKRIAELTAELNAAPKGSLRRQWLSEDLSRAHAELQPWEKQPDV